MRASQNRLYLFFITIYLAQGMVGIAYEPIYYLLKDVLKLSPSGSALFVTCMSAPFLLKPLLGILSDAFPIGLLRRRPYLIVSSLGTFAGWAALGLMGDYSYLPTLLLLTGVNVGICFADVLCDGVMVEEGKSQNKTGMFQAAQIATLYFTLLATGMGGGWLTAHMSFHRIFLLTSLFPLLILAVAFILPEKQIPDSRPNARLLGVCLGRLIRSNDFWKASLLILLFNFSPHLGTAWFYYQTESLGFSPLFIGTLTSISGVAGVLGAGLFWKICGRSFTLAGRRVHFDTPTLLRWSILAGIPLSLSFLFYRGLATAAAITAVSGILGVMMRLSLMDLAAKTCPEHGEATSFAVFMSVFNLAAWGSNMLGADLFQRLRSGSLGDSGSMTVLILFGTVCITACWPLRPAPMEKA